eukprot:m.391 g.391  ORF g.391 m.391 type:complete len:68 (-) comp557_c0_seq1:28-231(-)
MQMPDELQELRSLVCSMYSQIEVRFSQYLIRGPHCPRPQRYGSTTVLTCSDEGASQRTKASVLLAYT